MDHALNYSYIPERRNYSYIPERRRRMQGGDVLYNKMTSAHMFREAQDAEFEHKTKKVAEKVSEGMNIVANEPSLAFFRIQEHVRKSLPQLVDQKHEVQELQNRVQGASFDTEYATNAVKSLHRSTTHFQNIQDLMKNAMFMKQQIDYEQDRRDQEKVRPRMYGTASPQSLGRPSTPTTNPGGTRRPRPPGLAGRRSRSLPPTHMPPGHGGRISPPPIHSTAEPASDTRPVVPSSFGSINS